MSKRKTGAPPTAEFKAFTFDTKAVADEPDADGFVYIDAYASVFGNTDSHNDVMEKGAFTETLAAWAEKGAPIPSYYNHSIFSSDPMDNIGFLPVAQEDEKGLKVRVGLDVAHNTKAAYTHRLIKQDRLRELSIGYIAKKFAYSEEDANSWDRKRHLQAVDLLEVSMTPVASNSLATVTGKAAALLYGAVADAQPDEDDDDTEGEEKVTEAAKAADADTLAELATLAATATAAVAALQSAVDAALAADDADDDSDDGDEPADEKNGAGQKVDTKTAEPSREVRALLATTALYGAE